MINQDVEKKDKWCIIDIDGVLNDYPNCWLEFIKKNTGNKPSSLIDAKEKLSYFKYKNLKTKYRTTGYKRKIKPRKNSSFFLKELKKRGYKIAIVTARDVTLSYEDTYLWLKDNDLVYDRLVFDNKKHGKVFELLPFANFIVDDNSYICGMFAKFNIKSFLYNTPDNIDYQEGKKVKRVNNFEEILTEIGVIENEDTI